LISLLSADPFWKAKDQRWSIPGGTVSGSDFGSPLKGVSSEKMSVEGFGESKPLIDQRKRLGTSGQSTVEINIKEGQ
jgi:predicted NUDIX family NTP pyrophosphohydrolase